jgi:molybdopterin-containing oxidoreductase family iron-sulfur binding subunit
VSTDRRGFLGAAGAGAALTMLAPGVRLVDLVLAREEGEAVDDSVRWGMLIDTARCASGCRDCVDACDVENGIADLGRTRTDAQWIRKVDLTDERTGKEYSLPMLCQHCAEPPCVDVCPTGASFRRADGIVLVDKHICIGCRYCMMACPYKARSFIHEEISGQKTHAPRGKGTVESCTFCVHRVDRGRTPACVEACSAAAHGAMVFGDLDDPDSEVAARARRVASRQVRPDLDLDTGVRYENI